MARSDEHLNILASSEAAQRMSRRSFMAGSTVAALAGGGFLLASCTKGNPGDRIITGAPGASGGGTPQLEHTLNLFQEGGYDDPKVLKKFTDELGPAIKIDTWSSDPGTAVARLTAAAGSDRYDIVVPTGLYIPSLVDNDLLDELDLSRIPNFANLDPVYTNQPWDPNNKLSVCKAWGSTGWILDKRAISRPVNTWIDFIDVAMNEASGNVSLLAASDALSGLYFWANGIDWTTEKTSDMDAYEAFMVGQLAPHVKAFDSYPSAAFVEGDYAMSQVWNGDARQALLSLDNPDRYVWGLGAPATELWIDNYCIVKGASHPNAAYAWINFMLDPKNSLQDLEFYGYGTGIIAGVKEEAEAASLPYLDMLFPTDAQAATFRAGAVNSAHDRQVDIRNKAIAAARG